ncbi:MAG: tetratricopeptide repeat protein [Acidobacteriia bacterium]|nr:tetratricopeptide repeat protein [Terriglobia bacterium]
MKTTKAVAALLLLCIAALAQSDPADLIKQARKLNSEGHQDQALALYTQVLQADPNSYDAHLGAGIVLDLDGKYDEARRHFAKAIDLAPPEKKSQAQRNMAFSYAFEGKAADAARYEKPLYDEYMAKPNYFSAGEIANELARIYLESGDLDNARQWYKKGHAAGLKQPDIKPAGVDLWNFRWEHAQARIAARRGKRTEAEKHVAAAKAVLDKGTNPEQTPFYPYLEGYVAYYLGDYKSAIASLLKGDQRDPFILVLLAQAYEKSGDKTQAVDYYRKVMAVNNHNPTNAFARPIAKKKLS